MLQGYVGFPWLPRGFFRLASVLIVTKKRADEPLIVSFFHAIVTMILIIIYIYNLIRVLYTWTFQRVPNGC